MSKAIASTRKSRAAARLRATSARARKATAADEHSAELRPGSCRRTRDFRSRRACADAQRLRCHDDHGRHRDRCGHFRNTRAGRRHRGLAGSHARRLGARRRAVVHRRADLRRARYDVSERGRRLHVSHARLRQERELPVCVGAQHGDLHRLDRPARLHPRRLPHTPLPARPALLGRCTPRARCCC